MTAVPAPMIWNRESVRQRLRTVHALAEEYEALAESGFTADGAQVRAAEIQRSMQALLRVFDEERNLFEKFKHRQLKTAKNKRWKKKAKERFERRALEQRLRMEAEAKPTFVAEPVFTEHEKRIRLLREQNKRLLDLAVALDDLRRLRVMSRNLPVVPERVAQYEALRAAVDACESAAADAEQAFAAALARSAERWAERTEAETRAWYNRGNTDLDQLVSIREMAVGVILIQGGRREWDQYIVPAGSGSRIPAHWVDPAPPSSRAWARYLRPFRPSAQ